MNLPQIATDQLFNNKPGESHFPSPAARLNKGAGGEQHHSVHDELFPVDRLQTELSSAGIQASAYRAESLQVEQGFEFELVTDEGDRVSISMNRATGASSASYFESRSDEQGTSTSIGFSYEAYQRGSFNFSVQGDLNEHELEAIDGLLSQVGELSDKFYSGNLAEAFEKAVSIGYDAEQISAFSLDLSQTTSYSMIEQYRSVQLAADSQTPAGIRELAEYARGLQEALQLANLFADPQELLNQLMAFEDSLHAASGNLDEIVSRHQDLNQQLLEHLA